MPDSPTPFDLAQALRRAYETNDRINRYLIHNLDDAAWSAEPPGGKGRNIAAIFAHIHNVRLMWLRAVLGKDSPRIPEALDKDTVTRAEATRSLVQSHDALWDVLDDALAGGGRVKGFKPDVAGFFAYLVAHDAHHRGQVTMLARQLGHALPQKAMFGMWEWNTRGAEGDGLGEPDPKPVKKPAAKTPAAKTPAVQGGGKASRGGTKKTAKR